jgi:acetyl esterase/lipase
LSAYALVAKDWRRAISLVTKGYAVASINHRLSQHAVLPAQMENCKAAIGSPAGQREEV